MRDWAGAIGRKWFFLVAVYWVIFTVASTLIDLPRVYYESFVRQHAYGLSNQTIGKWASDQFANLAVTLVIGGLVLWVPYLLLRKSPTRWWLYTSALAVPFIITIVLVQPLWIDPLFNRFGPMQDKTLEAEILQLADRSGIEGGRVFEVAKSEDTKALNAYVTGFGATKRIVLWDTILKALDRPQLLSVMGHEMGHYVLGHVWKLIILLSVTILGLLYAVHRLSGALIATVRPSLRVHDARRRGVAAADHPAGGRDLARHQPDDAGGVASLRARSRSLRAGDHPRQPCRRECVRDHAAGESGGATAGAAVHLAPREPPAGRRAHRLLQRLPALGIGPARWSTPIDSNRAGPR